MTSPPSSPSPTPESPPTGHTDGNTHAWRYWKIQGKQLHSPLAGNPLPTDGTLHAGCHRPHLPPHPACQCGISVYLTAEDVLRAVEPLDPAQFVITHGTAHRPLMRDTVGQLYNYGGTLASGPPSYRCRAYTVHTIYTDNTAIPLDYEYIPRLPTEAVHSLR